MEQEPSEMESFHLAIAIAFVLGFGNFLCVPLTRGGALGELLPIIWSGVACAQVALIAVWIPLAPGTLVSRVASGTAVALILFGMFLLGASLSVQVGDIGDRTGFLHFIYSCVCGFPLISLAAQAPLWIVRVGLRWHLTLPGKKRETPTERPLAIRDLFTATAAVAVVFALARLVRVPPFADDSATVMVELLIAAGVVMIVSAATTLPLTLVIFRSREPALGCATTATIQTILFALGVVIIAALAGGSPSGTAFLYLLSAFVAFIATQAVVLLLARHQGVRFAGIAPSDAGMSAMSSNK